jgi:valyl-tRNA synthetase
VNPGAKVPLELRVADERERELLRREIATVEFLVKTDGTPVLGVPGKAKPRGTVVSLAGDVEVLVGLRGLVEPAKERERVERSLKKVAKDLGVLEKRLANANYLANAPAEVVAEVRSQKEQLERQRERLLEAQALIGELEA